MAKKSGKSAIPNWKKKKWLELVAPSIYSDKVVGESLVESPEDLIGKVVTVNLMHILGSPRKQNFSVKLRVEKVQGKTGLTKPIKISMLPSSVRRLIRAGKNRVDMSFTTKSKDGVVLRFKPLIITRNKASSAVLTDIRAKAAEHIADFCSNNGYEVVFDSVTRSTLQRELKTVLSKVYPLKMVEMRTLEVELDKGTRILPGFEVAAPVEEATEEVKEEVKSEEAETKEKKEE
jgi:small subunit ribosomal protein S3Ae